ncbi:MAG: class I SAM-dependent methyltransferase [Anaerolineae bacterium]|nr:class I SAM-dependent methyltransferase [Anaerolineae bacterium]
MNEASSSTSFFDAAYRERPPWDIGAAQPDLMALLDEYPPSGPVLDVGCGTGDLALALAQRGLRVLGVDLAEAAIVQARAKAAEAGEVGQRVEFRVADALQPSLLPGPFGAVVDSGFFHLFGPDERDRFAHDLAAACAPGGRYYLLGFAIEARFPNAPRPVRDEELRALFAPEHGWRILALRPARFLVGPACTPVPAVAACLERV